MNFKKYLDKKSVAFGVGVIVGGAIYNMFIVDRLPALLKGGA